MKFLVRFTLALGMAGIAAITPLQAQANSLETRALRENVNRLQSQLDDLTLSYSALKKELDSLRSELRKVRAQSSQKDPSAATRGDIENLAKTIREVDRKRSADKELILKEMKSLVRNIPKSRPNTSPPATPPRSQKGFEHSVQSGETISAIIAAYNEVLKNQGTKKRITLKSVLTANPKLNPRSIQIGQVLFIPDPR
ncbi:MAG: hypothetical protein CMO63_04900 [Verrucomicrobiales bacterium]|nr:hypothetical protein [Verrucomicrobiales bacterium]